jgi:ribosome-associated protein
VDIIRGALIAPKRRVATRPTRGSKERRLAGKKQRGSVKRSRGPAWSED